MSSGPPSKHCKAPRPQNSTRVQQARCRAHPLADCRPARGIYSDAHLRRRASHPLRLYILSHSLPWDSGAGRSAPKTEVGSLSTGLRARTPTRCQRLARTTSTTSICYHGYFQIAALICAPATIATSPITYIGWEGGTTVSHGSGYFVVTVTCHSGNLDYCKAGIWNCHYQRGKAMTARATQGCRAASRQMVVQEGKPLRKRKRPHVRLSRFRGPPERIP